MYDDLNYCKIFEEHYQLSHRILIMNLRASSQDLVTQSLNILLDEISK